MQYTLVWSPLPPFFPCVNSWPACSLVQGYFRYSLPAFRAAYPHRPIAVLRMDGDMYESTMVRGCTALVAHKYVVCGFGSCVHMDGDLFCLSVPEHHGARLQPACQCRVQQSALLGAFPASSFGVMHRASLAVRECMRH